MEETITPLQRPAPTTPVEWLPRAREAVLARLLTQEKRTDLLAFFLTTVQLGLLVLVIKYYRIEARPFRVVFAMVCCGFVVHHFLPRRFKLPFFVMLSTVAMAVTLGAANSAMVIGTGLVILAICHLPIGWEWRIAGLLAAAAVLAAMRLQLFSISEYSAVLTILGSIFMFRLIVYVYDIKNGVRGNFWQAAGYFFMLPNPCFPLFPVVDYQTFVRTAYEGSRAAVYQRGLHFILRGIVHLLLLRYLNSVLSADAKTIVNARDLFAFMLAAFSGYLKVSGTFHIIVGMLHLFEFNLPETHHNYLLSSSFTDFWRRINIYWKDFIQKIVFYPIYFRLRRFGPIGAIVLSTAIAIVITWAFHSYQWFWLKGVVLISPTDIAFWAILGLLLTANSWYEVKFSLRRATTRSDRSLRAAAILGLKTSATMTVILVLWSMWTTDSFALWFDIMKRGTNGSLADYALVVGGLSVPGLVATGMALATRQQPALAMAKETIDARWLVRRNAPIFLGALGLLLAALPALQTRLGPTFASVASVITSPRMSAQGNAILEQGYYENLTNAARLNPELAALYAQTPPDWPGESPFRAAKDWMVTEVTPSKVFRYYRKTVTTNRWGMRDREYDLAKPPGTLRIGLFGESHTFGNGVDDQQVYEELVEEAINKTGMAAPVERVEILNFSTPGYGPIFKFALLEKKGFKFDLDAVIQTAISNEEEWTIRNLTGSVIEGAPIPYPYVADIVRKAGVSKEMTPSVIKYRLSPYANDLIRWVYAEYAKSCRKHGARPFLLFLPKPEYDLGHDRAFGALRKIAESEGIGILDITDAYDSAGDLQGLWVAPWDNHPNARGHRLLADSFLRALQSPAGRELLSPSHATQTRPTE